MDDFDLIFLSCIRFRNGDIIETSNSNEESLVIPNVDTRHAGTYKCRVENEMGAVYSEQATLTVNGTSSLSIKFYILGYFSII